MKNFLSTKPAQPLIYAFCIVLGLLGGKKLYQGQSYQLGFSNSETSKGKLYDILKKVDEYYVDTVNFRDLEEKTIAKILENLDPHSYYLSSEDMQSEDERLNGNFSGIGVEFKIISDTIVVMNAIEGGPSFKVGIEVGDKIITVNKKSFTGDSIDSKLAMKYLKGEVGSTVQVDFLRNHKIINKVIVRGEVPLNSIDVSTVLKGEIGYIKISRFSKRTSAEFQDAVDLLLQKNIKSLIIDVRNNPGGLMSSVVEICESFLEKNELIVYTKGRGENEEERSRGKGKLANYPLYVLINENSASASEILAGAVQDNDRGTIIGRRSFGKGLVQRPFSLKDGSALRLTIARYYTPTGRCIQRSYEEGNEEYYHENYTRIISGELNSADSIPVPDSLKFYTPKGKLVYGGGGIIPDEFVPADTSSLSELTVQIFNENSIDHFFLEKISKWNKLLLNRTIQESYKYLLTDNLLWEEFENYLKKQSYTTEYSYNLSELQRRIQPILLQKILRLKFNENGQFYHRMQTDPEIVRAVDLHFGKAADTKP